MKTLYSTDFRTIDPGWTCPGSDDTRFDDSGPGFILDGRDRPTRLDGPGIHTANGDTIELRFEAVNSAKGKVTFGFSGGMESADAILDIAKRTAELRTSDWSSPQPADARKISLKRVKQHVLRVEKQEGCGDLVKMADLTVVLDDQVLLKAHNVNVLPEMGVRISVEGGAIRLCRFTHRGESSGIPENLHVAGWQILNEPDIDANLAAILRGIQVAAEKGVQLLVTPETSLTGLFPRDAVTKKRKPIEAAESKLRKAIKGIKNAPYCVVGLPVWESRTDHRRRSTRYNVSRVYDPDGHIVDTYPKIHSCETEFWHGYRLQEFDVDHVPICMHICHDGRYPETWTLPVMFGSRLILHPSNGGTITGSVDALEKGASRSTTTSHAFYVNVNGGGGSYIAGPQKYHNVLDVSAECRRDNDAFPMVGPPVDCLIESRIRIHDAYGYWPVRSFRASEEIAAAQLALYRSLGGHRV